MQPNYTKLKTNLRLCIQRLKLLEKKKTENALKARKEIADYIALGKPDRARIKVESIIREDYLVEAMELIEMFCDLLIARFGLIQQEKTLDDGLAEAISSLIWVAPRLQADVSELKIISDLFAMKYGKQYPMAAKDNAVGTVSLKLQAKLSVQAPPKILVEQYLIEIAKKFNVPFEPDQEVMKEAEQYREVRDAALQAAEEAREIRPLIDLGNGAVGGTPVVGIPIVTTAVGYVPSVQSPTSSSVPGSPPNPGFNVMTGPGFIPPPDLPAPIKPNPSPEKAPIGIIVDDVSHSWPAGPPTVPSGHLHESPPPKYDTVVSSSVPANVPLAQAKPGPTPTPRTTKPAAEGADILNLPEVPDDSPEHKDSGSSGGEKKDGDDNSFDDLAKRFEALKKRK